MAHLALASSIHLEVMDCVSTSHNIQEENRYRPANGCLHACLVSATCGGASTAHGGGVKLATHRIPVVIVHRHANTQLQRVRAMVAFLVPVVWYETEGAYGHPPRHCKEHRSNEQPHHETADRHASPCVPGPQEPLICISGHGLSAARSPGMLSTACRHETRTTDENFVHRCWTH